MYETLQGRNFLVTELNKNKVISCRKKNIVSKYNHFQILEGIISNTVMEERFSHRITGGYIEKRDKNIKMSKRLQLRNQIREIRINYFTGLMG